MKDFNGRELKVGNKVVAVENCGIFVLVGAIGKVERICSDNSILVKWSKGKFLVDEPCSNSWFIYPERVVRV